ncbi:hypothetical protein D3C76_1368970 [compost metagenome]
MLMIRPPWPMCRAAACVATKTLRTFTARVRSKSSRLNSASGPTASTPALLTRMSRPPKASAVLCTACCTALASALSALMARALPPAAMMLCCRASAWAVALA